MLAPLSKKKHIVFEIQQIESNNRVAKQPDDDDRVRLRVRFYF